MKFKYGAPIIEFYGNLIRVGKEGKWVDVIAKPPGMRPSKRELIALIEKMDRERTQ
jgi:hypothetical protein